MALNQSTLASNLETWIDGKENYNSISESMSEFADQYESYALNAIDISGDNPLVVQKAAMLAILNTITENETPASAAQKFEDAVIAFWTGATFALTIPPPGSIAPEISANVTSPPTTGSIKPGLQTIFEDLDSEATVSSKANEIATELHNGTITTQVTCIGTAAVPPPPTIIVVGPIS